MLQRSPRAAANLQIARPVRSRSAEAMLQEQAGIGCLTA